MQNKYLGSLYVVATPIGNLGDITERALATLKQVARIAAEDTRHAQHLLNHFHIHKPLLSLHQVNEHERIDTILAYLANGEDVALISDAGTPLISDPGYPLIRAVQEHGGKVVPIPGACALITALCAAGLSTVRFAFEGFLPAKPLQRQAHLSTLLHDARTLIFYESPHRIIATINDMRTVFGDERQLVIARELTKRYEEFIRGTPGDVLQYFAAHPDKERGEIVIMVAGANERDVAQDDDNALNTLRILLEELPTKQAVNLAHKLTGERKNRLYEMALQHKAD